MTRPATLAAAAYLALSLAITWPLATRLFSGVAGEVNTSLTGVWAMATVSQKISDVLTGPRTLTTFWDANIFYPAPKALLYSEHLTAQALLTLPIWWITGNGLLIYNFAIIASFVATGVGTFLLTRAFTGGMAAPLVAGLFAVFTLAQLPHGRVTLDLLSIQWLPFALLCWHRYVERGTWRLLALTVLCAWLLNASSTGYLWASLPILIAFAVLDLAVQRRLRQLDRWIGLAIAVPATALLSAPFILPLAELQRQGLVPASGSGGIGAVSAGLALGELVINAAALIGVIFAFRRHPQIPRSRIWLLLALMALAIIVPVVRGATSWGENGGPDVRTFVHSLSVFAWLVTLLAGIGLSAIERRRHGPLIVAAAGALVALVSWPPVFTASDGVSESSLERSSLQPPSPYLQPTTTLPPIYRAVASLPSDAVVAEFPFGSETYELRYMFFAATHRRRLMNGHADRSPPSYLARVQVLTTPLLDPEQSVRALGGATHVIVHGRAWSDDTGVRIARWLESIGGQLVPTSGDALLYQMVAPERFASR